MLKIAAREKTTALTSNYAYGSTHLIAFADTSLRLYLKAIFLELVIDRAVKHQRCLFFFLNLNEQ